MPSSTKQKAPKGSGAASSSRKITDPRFQSLQTDPRYRLPSRKNQRVQLDDRFSRMLKDEDFSRKASVDRYGRKISKDTGRKELERFYRLDDTGPAEEESGDDDDEVEQELARVSKKYDPAREGGFSESSSSEEESDEEDQSDEDEADDIDVQSSALRTAPGRPHKEDVPLGDVTSRLAVVNLDWDHIRAVDLMAVASSFCPDGGKLLKVSVYPSEFGRERMEREELEGPPRELFISKKNGTSARPDTLDDDGEEDSNSPFSDEEEDDEDSDDEDDRIKKQLLADQTDDTANIDSHALREYQLSRLRYYYAVLLADSEGTAHAIYEDMDGREYLSTSNFFDLRFIPDEVTFDTDKPRDECKSVPPNYKPNDFVTEALTHSKVRLTWDEEDRSRKEVQKRAFSQREIEDNDLQAYIGSDSDGESDEDAELVNEPAEKSTDKKSSRAAALRAALGLPSTADSSKSSNKGQTTSGNMQITFTAGLSSNPKADGASVFENTPDDVREESTREKYIRKERERKARRKAKAKAGHTGDDEEANEDHSDLEDAPAGMDSEDEISASDEDDDVVDVAAEAAADKDDPFNDPFFDDPETANRAARKQAKASARAAKATQDAAKAELKKREAAQLELLMQGDAHGEDGRGFDMAEIRKAEKDSGRRKGKGKGKRARRGQEEQQDEEKRKDGFEMDVADPRFKGVFESIDYAIDPTNPRFSGTSGMKRLLEEGRKKRKDGAQDEEDVGQTKKSKKRDTTEEDGEIDRLLAKVKRRKA